MPTLLERANAYLAHGFSILPIAVDGSKAPAWELLPLEWNADEGKSIHVWKPYQSLHATPDELHRWFGLHNVGIAVVAGAISGNLEILDFDRPGLWEEWKLLAEEHGLTELIAKIVWIDTPGGGKHGYYRCEEPPAGSQKLAKDEKGKTLIETKGEGGYVVAPGSPARCHPTGKPYQFAARKMNKTPVLTAQEVNSLHLVATAFHAYADPEQEYKPQERRERQPGDGLRPGDDYNERGPILEVLEKHGWKVRRFGQRCVLTRPGKVKGVSATFGAVADYLYVFSSNALPFAEHRAYSRFAVYALLEHGGDFHEAARALAAEGYGERSQPASIGFPAIQPIQVEPEDEIEDTEAASSGVEATDDADDLPEGEALPDMSAPEELAPDAPLPGLLPQIAALYADLPVEVERYALVIRPEASGDERRAIFRGVANLSKDTVDWLFWAQGDAWNGLPGDWGAKCAFVESCFRKKKKGPLSEEEKKEFNARYVRLRQLGSIARHWPKPYRGRTCRSFYELTAGVKDVQTRIGLLERWTSGGFENWEALKQEVRIIKAAQKEAKERQEAAQERYHQARVTFLCGEPDTDENATSHATTTPDRAEVMPRADAPQMARAFRQDTPPPPTLSAQIAQKAAALEALPGHENALQQILAQLQSLLAQSEKNAVAPRICSDNKESEDSLFFSPAPTAPETENARFDLQLCSYYEQSSSADDPVETAPDREPKGDEIEPGFEKATAEIKAAEFSTRVESRSNPPAPRHATEVVTQSVQVQNDQVIVQGTLPNGQPLVLTASLQDFPTAPAEENSLRKENPLALRLVTEPEPDSAEPELDVLHAELYRVWSASGLITPEPPDLIARILGYPVSSVVRTLETASADDLNRLIVYAQTGRISASGVYAGAAP